MDNESTDPNISNASDSSSELTWIVQNRVIDSTGQEILLPQISRGYPSVSSSLSNISFDVHAYIAEGEEQRERFAGFIDADPENFTLSEKMEEEPQRDIIRIEENKSIMEEIATTLSYSASRDAHSYNQYYLDRIQSISGLSNQIKSEISVANIIPENLKSDLDNAETSLRSFLEQLKFANN